MKKILFSALILSLLLATLTACGAEAKQPTTPEPAPKIEEPKPEPLAAPEKNEISQEELEPIFETVFTEASENHPEDWSIDFQITDEIGKITKAIPDDKKAPANLREIYIEWRAAKTDEENYAEIDRMLAEAAASLDGYDEEREGTEVVLGVTEEDIQANQDTSGEDSYDEGRDYDPNYTDEFEPDPDLEAKLAALGADSGPSNYVDPTAGLTEEEIQQKIEDSYDTEFRVNGT